ncbi:unnamed protein product [Paramecium octaurelia]|uniref:Leucine-rich repeat and coiled-coil domain-containing protein 1 n=1 Tax=Paramecium octaurelia TaxID=43137 RepID=A0A8S1V0W6_PAROT|nr:unnamed protein product [Paramecium octaurelia]
MEDDDDFDPNAEKTMFNIKYSSIKDIRELNNGQMLSLRIMHSPDLVSMQGIEQFRQLKQLNLSQNSIQAMNLRTLNQLEVLNLQSNRIKVINCEGLRSLRVLNLSYNLISLLGPLQIFTQQGYQLKSLDLRSNSISDLNELKYLQGINLQDVFFNSDRRKNPICEILNQYYKQIIKYVPQIVNIDNKPRNELQENDGDGSNNITFKLPKQQQANIEKEAEMRVEVIQLQQKVKELSQQNKEIIYKFECNEKYWSSKCSNLEREIIDLNKFNQELNQENKRFRREIESLNEQNEYDKQQQKDLINKKERKDELITQLQNKISELLQLNGQLSKENQILIEQQNVQKVKDQEKDFKLSEYKIQLKEAEKQLQEFHKNAVEQASQTLMRQEQLQSKSEQINQENRSLYQDNSQLKRRIQELLEICREWEVKFETSQKENEQQLQIQLQQVVHEYEQKLQVQQSQYEQQLQEFETESKLMQDQLENEFRNLFQENMEKFKQLKLQYDEKCRIEVQQSQEIKILQGRLLEQESLIKELQSALIRLKREVQEFCQEKDLAKREHQIIQSGLQKDINFLQEQLLESQTKLQQFDRELRLKNDELSTINQENDRLRAQNKQKIQNEQLVDELQTNLTIKNKMLDDKNDTIDELKQQLNQLRNQEGNASDDYLKLQKKYDRQSQIIDELESQLQQIQEEYDQKNKDLKDKKQLIAMFEKEIEEIEIKQDREINGLKLELQEKEGQLQELVKMLNNAKEELIKKDEKIRELLVQYQGIEKQLFVIDKQNEITVKQKDKQIVEMRSQLQQIQEELNLMIQENIQLKTKARENLQNLHKLFQQ